MNRFKKILKWTLIALATPIVLVYGINLFDVPLDPAIDSFKPSYPPDLTEQNNGYYYLMGMRAERGRDPQVAGKQFVDALNAAKAAGKTVSEDTIKKLEIEALGNGRTIKLIGKFKILCRYSYEQCLPVYLRNKKQIRRLLGDNKLIVQRSERLLEYPHFAETMASGVEMPMMDFSSAYHQLLLAKIAITADSGQTTRALRSLQKINQFWHVVLAESTSLLGKLFADSYLDRTTSLASEIMANYALTPEQITIVHKILKPLTKQEMDASNLFRSNYQLLDALTKEVIVANRTQPMKTNIFGLHLPNFVIFPLFKTNATLNDAYKKYRRCEQINKMTSPEFLRYLRTDARKEISSQNDIHWSSLYNPVGKYVSSISYIDYGLFLDMARMRNLEAKIRLLTVRLNIQKNRVSKKEIPDFLAGLDNSLRNPYTGEAPHWDPKKSAIEFNVMSKNLYESLDNPLSEKMEISIQR